MWENSSYNYSSQINHIDISEFIDKNPSSHKQLFDSPTPPPPRQDIAIHNMNDSPQQHSRDSYLHSHSDLNIPSMAESDSMMYDYSQYHESPHREILLSPQEQQKESIKMKELSKTLKQVLMSLGQPISNSDLKEYCLRKVKNSIVSKQNMRRRYHNVIKKMREVNFITLQKKMIVVTKPSDKHIQRERYKDQILTKQYHIELKRDRLKQLNSYKEVLGRIISRNVEENEIASKKIRFQLNVICHSLQPKLIKVVKPTRQARYTIKIPDVIQNLSFKTQFQLLYQLMKDRLPIKTISE